MEPIDYDKARLAGLTGLAFVLTVGLPYLLFQHALSGPAGRYFLAPALTILTYLIVWRSISILLSKLARHHHGRAGGEGDTAVAVLPDSLGAS